MKLDFVVFFGHERLGEAFPPENGPQSGNIYGE